MIILVFTGGIGNQLFEYAFYCHLKEVLENESFYGNYTTKTKEHYGLEIDKWFNISLPPEKWWSNIVLGVLYLYKKFFPKSELFDLNQIEWKNKKAKVYFPFKFNKTYIPQNKEWLKWKIEEKYLCRQNLDILEFIRNNNTCFVHIRRGDYFLHRYKNLFEGCCTKEYYEKATNYIISKYPNVRFICFSDDIQWSKNYLFAGKDVLFVTWNTGTNSPLDMYLMSQCANGIIANSTFSYWGAQLGIEKETVVYPCKWWNSKIGNPNIFPDHWIGL